jgi:hypothetical protein
MHGVVEGRLGRRAFRKRTGCCRRWFLLPPREIAGLLHGDDVLGVGCGRHGLSRCNRRLLYPLRENLYLLLQRLDLPLALLQLALTLLQLAMALLHLALTLLQLLLYLHQQLGHIISGVYGYGPKEGCSDAAISDRATYETSPYPHLTAVTDREFGVERCSQLLLARRADDVIPGEAQSSPISLGDGSRSATNCSTRLRVQVTSILWT